MLMRASIAAISRSEPSRGARQRDNQLISKNSYFLAVASLQVVLLGPISAANSNSDECGLASVYSTNSEATASGEDTQSKDFTGAHPSLPFGTLVHVGNQENGRSVVVRITDRGPFVGGRIIDLSKIAARELRISGLANVCLSILPAQKSRSVPQN